MTMEQARRGGNGIIDSNDEYSPFEFKRSTRPGLRELLLTILRAVGVPL